MSIALYLKNNLKNIPVSIGRFINLVPYDLRPGIGSVYRKRKSELKDVNNYNLDQKRDFAFKRIKDLVVFSYTNIKFYKEYYDSKGFHPDHLISFESLNKIPIITKDILNRYPIEDRSFSKARYIVNTGGSSGEPFSFYVEPSSIGHEWTHMHHIWEKLGYYCSDLKLTFGGRSDVKNTIEYDVVRNHFSIDIYAPYEKICEKLRSIGQKHKIEYLHGYPSSIYDFALYCEQNEKELLKILNKNLKGAFLGSEYPHKHYRNKIEEVFNIKTISWYGHTERAVLAYEKETKFKYHPFLSYGFAEAISNDNNEYNLVSTSYYNYASPLIRYNTEDIIEKPNIEEGILESFLILKGRSGEFVIDKQGKSINLTGLVFGRHHDLFNYSKFIQVKQESIGKLIIYFVSESIDNEQAFNLFDKDNLDFDISFERLNEPIKTISGKINLLIK